MHCFRAISGVLHFAFGLGGRASLQANGQIHGCEALCRLQCTAAHNILERYGGRQSYFPRNPMMTRQTKKSMPARGSPGQTSPAPCVCVRGTGDKLTTGVKYYDHIRSKYKLFIGTWNVETLWKDGRLEELCHELEHYKWNIIGLSEVRMKALGEINSFNGHKLFYCGRDHLAMST